ncbi:MAG: efflux RND transporter permease subunit [Desulfobacterales bacterium]|nr:efflux RND transporter permease subunit [Desulfobacterales bacterium]
MADVKQKGALAWMAGNSVAANLFMAVLLVGGLVMGLQTKQEIFPRWEVDTVSVTVPYPGASPEEVERGIVLAVEEALQGLEGIDEMRSTASEGVGMVYVDALEGYDVNRLAQDVEGEVDRITSFPDEAETPVVKIPSYRRDAISFSVYGDQDERVLRAVAESLRDRLLARGEITQVDLGSVRDYEILVEVDQSTLRRYGLTLNDVASRIRQGSVELPAGSLKTRGGEIMIRIKDRRYLARGYETIPVITHGDGSQVTLGELAVVRDGFEDTDRFALYNGLPAVNVEVYRVGDQTPLVVAGAAKEVVADFEHELTDGVHVGLIRDMSDIFRQRADLLLKNGYMGLGLVFIFLALFLEIRLAFWVAMGIPISFLGAFVFFPFTDFTINMVSMFAFIVTLGIVVDDAIVVGENIYAKRQQGQGFFQAAVEGVREIAMPVTFSVLTNIVAFMPLLFVSGWIGTFFKNIPMVVIMVFAVSLVECLFILPAHLSHQSRRAPWGPFGWLHHRQQVFSHAFVAWVRRVYGPFLQRVIEYRYTTLALALVVLMLTVGYVKSGRMGFVLFPRIESDFAFVTATLPYGSAQDRVKQVEAKLVTGAKAVIADHGGDTLARGMLSRISENVITLRVMLTGPTVRPMHTEEFVQKWRRRVGEIPGLESLNYQSDRGGPGRGSAITIELTHPDVGILEQAGRELALALEGFSNVKDVDDGSASGKEQLDFKMTALGQRLGLQARDVARQVRYAFYGAEAVKLQRGRNEVTVRVRLPEAQRTTEDILTQMVLRTPSGGEVLLGDVVSVERGRAYTSIDRRNQNRITKVTADVVPRPQANAVLAELSQGALPELVRRYPGLAYDFQGRQADMKESVTGLMYGLLGAMCVIFALLAIPFRSYFQPLIIMACIPFGIVGAVMGHIFMGYSLSVMSMFGVVALSGVVVNDSLVFIDFANRERGRGASPHHAVCEAGIQRFRPILLTTLTTFAGLAPMMFETSRQARFLIPMALSLGFGIVFATLITLILVPTLYVILEDVVGLYRN